SRLQDCEIRSGRGRARGFVDVDRQVRDHVLRAGDAVVEDDRVTQSGQYLGRATALWATLGAVRGIGEERRDAGQVATVDALGIAMDERGDRLVGVRHRPRSPLRRGWPTLPCPCLDLDRQAGMR